MQEQEEVMNLKEPEPELEWQLVAQEEPAWRPWVWVEVEQKGDTFELVIGPVEAFLQKATLWTQQRVGD